MRLSDGCLNYFILQELYLHWYKSQFKKMSGFSLTATTYSIAGEPAFTMLYEGCYYKSISRIELGYAAYAGDFKEFTIAFNFSKVSITPIMGAGPDRYMPRT